MLTTIAWVREPNKNSPADPKNWTFAHWVELDDGPFEKLEAGVDEGEEHPDVFQNSPRRKTLCGARVPGRTKAYVALGSPLGVCSKCEAARDGD
jgi:hypothetical protein